MFPLSLRRSSAKPAKADPAPSRWSWRMQRLMLTPGFRLALRAGVPFCLTLMAATIYLSNEERREAIALAVSDARRSIEERPEFMVKLMAVDGATGALAANVRALVRWNFPSVLLIWMSQPYASRSPIWTGSRMPACGSNQAVFCRWM